MDENKKKKYVAMIACQSNLNLHILPSERIGMVKQRLEDLTPKPHALP